MILVALGANLPSDEHGSPINTLRAALTLMESRGVKVKARSRFYRSAPVPPSEQPWYINAVAEVETGLPANRLLALLHDIEIELGRTRRQRWEARVIDLDLLDYHSVVTGDQPDNGGPLLPHPRLTERAFVLLPLQDVAPNWRHPVLELGVADLIRRLGKNQTAVPLVEGEDQGSWNR